jgi:hypothetical protein
MKNAVSAIFLLASLTGCSTIVEGRSQQINITTNPDGANCTLTRKGDVIAKVAQTPGGVYIEKTKYDITITCDKEGYQQVKLLNKSGADAATFANIILGGGIGWAIDSATGSDNKYDSPVSLTLTKTDASTATNQ